MTEAPIPTPRQANLRAIEAIAKRHGLTLAEIMSARRFRRYVHARQDAFALFKARGWSLPKIAGLFGMDHTTVLYGIRERQAREARLRQLQARGAVQ